MFYINDSTLERFIKEDVPYMDLTTFLLGIGNKEGTISFTAREAMVVSCTEEVVRLFEKLHIHVVHSLPSGTRVSKGDTFLTANGTAEELHVGWKVALNILEYCCGIATRTRLLVDKATAVDAKISVVTTRKCFPGTKELAIKSIMAGGALPHRLGLSETILIFQQHMNFLGSMENVRTAIQALRHKACEKKIIIEAQNEDEAMEMIKMDIDGLQFDKIPVVKLQQLVCQIRAIKPDTILIAAGGINVGNVAEYATTGVNAIATTSVYFGKPADIQAKIEGRTSE